MRSTGGLPPLPDRRHRIARFLVMPGQALRLDADHGVPNDPGYPTMHRQPIARCQHGIGGFLQENMMEPESALVQERLLDQHAGDQEVRQRRLELDHLPFDDPGHEIGRRMRPDHGGRQPEGAGVG